MRKAVFLLWILVCAFGVFGQIVAKGSKLSKRENHPVSPERLPSLFHKDGNFQGALYASNAKGVELGACPLKNTAVNVEISGFVARVRVVQDFTNTFNEPVEAVYTFPLSQNGAVDDMTMTVGTRVIRGKVLKRDEARQVYDEAKAEGKTASLLDQERTNIFTQSVANIMPGESVKIEISYVETLKYEDGEYEFVFPMTVGPRYIPGSVKDAAKISPPIATTRAGHDISINLNLNAGVPVEGVRSSSHQIDQLNYSAAVAKINLKGETTIPNKDFVLRYDVTGKRIEDALIAHRGGRGGFFTLVLQPPDKIANEDRTPKEIVFVLDTSGSMDGFPIEKAKEAMKLSLDGLYPEDTFNLITFAGDTNVLFETPVPATQANLELAQQFLASREGSGGTEMMNAIKAAFAPSGSKEHLRIVCFMTDAYVGNENEIVAEIQRNPQARVFSFGIGNSVNRALLDKMAEAGRGEVEYVALDDDGSKAAKRFYERVRSPLLTDLSIEWNGMPVADVYPSKLGDLFSAKPVVVKGRYTKGARGTIKLRGKVAGMPYERSIDVNLPEAESANDSLASLWARQRVEELSSDALNAAKPDAINKQITDLGLEFRLLTQFTSFVAVEERIVNQNGNPVKMEVPVEAPDGVDMEKAGGRYGDPNSKFEGLSTGAGGGGGGLLMSATVSVREKGRNRAAKRTVGKGNGSGSGYGGGSGSGSAGAPPPAMARVSLAARAINMPMPEYPAGAKAAGATGIVAVQVTITAQGKVTSAVALSGHPLLRAPAVKAAESSMFEPAMVGGVPLTTRSIINYDFNASGVTSSVQHSVGAVVNPAVPESRPLTPQEAGELRLKQKLHVWLYAVVDRIEKSAAVSPNESMFVRDGKASVELTFNGKVTPTLLAQLKAIGFEVEKSDKSSATGTIAIEKLRELADVYEIKYVMPRVL